MDFSNLSPQANEFYQKGLAALKKKNYDYATALFKDILKLHPGFTLCQHKLWMSIREKRKSFPPSFFSLVIEKLKIAFLGLKFLSYLVANKIERAILAQEQIILLNPDNTSALHGLATIFMRQGAREKAKVTFEQIILCDQKNIPALKALAQLYFEEEDYQKAKLMAKFLSELRPHDLAAEKILKDIAAIGAIKEGFNQ